MHFRAIDADWPCNIVGLVPLKAVDEGGTDAMCLFKIYISHTVDICMGFTPSRTNCDVGLSSKDSCTGDSLRDPLRGWDEE